MNLHQIIYKLKQEKGSTKQKKILTIFVSISYPSSFFTLPSTLSFFTTTSITYEFIDDQAQRMFLVCEAETNLIQAYGVTVEVGYRSDCMDLKQERATSQLDSFFESESNETKLPESIFFLLQIQRSWLTFPFSSIS